MSFMSANSPDSTWEVDGLGPAPVETTQETVSAGQDEKGSLSTCSWDQIVRCPDCRYAAMLTATVAASVRSSHPANTFFSPAQPILYPFAQQVSVMFAA
jgi:hypothetical protein